MRITLVGPQNTGKSTLFNALGSTAVETANYPGSTVERNITRVKSKHHLDATLIDTPGLPCLTPNSIDQQITVDNLYSDEAAGDIIVAVIDATQLSRHLYLIRQLQQAGFPFIVCLDMVDILHDRGGEIDVGKLADKLDATVVVADPRRGEISDLVEAIKTTAAQQPETAPELVKLEKPSSEELISIYEELETIVSDVITMPEGAVDTHAEINKLDAIFLHPILGLGLFCVVMVAVFSSIFWAATPFMDIIDGFFGDAIGWTQETMPDGWMGDLMAEGVVGGIGSVVIFLPQIFILFLFLVILQDSGYLARGAVLIDRPLSKIGLNGRSFVPLLSGFACAIPAMMAARTIQNRKERLLTIMCVPLMSCSARLPVYALLLAFLLPDEPLKAGLALAGLYILGIVLAIIVASIVSRLPSFADRQHTPFILELPAYRRPVAGVVFKTTCRRSWQFLKKAGPTILVISIILWVSTHLPASGAAEGDEYVAVSNSYAAKVGKVLEPAAEPMGLDWRGGVSMIMGFAAREVFVSAMVLMYRVNDSGDEEALEEGLLSTMHEVTFEGTDKQIFTTSTCVGLLFFFAMALQCFPTVVTARNEMGGWKMAILMTVFYTGGAYIGAVILVQGLRAFGVA